MSTQAREALRRKYGHLSAADVNAFLARLPRDMLFLMRTWALVRNLNRELGGTTRQRLLVIAEYAAAGASLSDSHHHARAADGGQAPSFVAWPAGMRSLVLRLRMRTVVRCVDYYGTLLRLRARLAERWAARWARLWKRLLPG